MGAYERLVIPIDPYDINRIIEQRGDDVDPIEVFTDLGQAFDEAKPSVRLVATETGKQACRFVRPLYIAKLSKRASKGLFINDKLADKYYVPVKEQPVEFTEVPVIQSFGENLLFELNELSEFGVPVRTPKVQVGKIPEFQEKTGELIGHITGLVIKTDLIIDQDSDQENPDKIKPTLDKYKPNTKKEAKDLFDHTNVLYQVIRNYLEYKQQEEEPFLGAIISPKSYMFGSFEHGHTPDTWLIKTDPIFMSPTDKHFEYAFEAADQAEHLIISALTEQIESKK